jgi:hypothetical protein
MLIEQLRQITFKIKVMDYIARKAFFVEEKEKPADDINGDLKKITEVTSLANSNLGSG